MRAARGLTLIEVLVVMTLVVVLIGVSLLISMESYRGTSFRNERNTVIALLQRARSQSMANFCQGCNDGKPHGVAIRPADNPNKYVLFQGTAYSTRDMAYDSIFDASPHVEAAGMSEVVFAQLSAITTTSGGSLLTLSDFAGYTSVISLGSEGQISWTN